MKPSVSIIVPAFNEEGRIVTTLEAIRKAKLLSGTPEIIVVDDGSTDRTFELACRQADDVIRNKQNRGKGAAMSKGCEKAKAELIVFIDADLGASAIEWVKLVDPIVRNEFDMTIAKLPAPRIKGGFGLVKSIAINGIYWLSGYESSAPLSGQRAIRRSVLEQIGGFPTGFGVEVGMTIDVARAGFRIGEIPVSFHHRETGRDLAGFYHRGKQFAAVTHTLWQKWRTQ